MAAVLTAATKAANTVHTRCAGAGGGTNGANSTFGSGAVQSLWGARSQFAVQREECMALIRGEVDAIYSDGAMAPNLLTPAGGSAMPASIESVTGDLHSARMTIDGRDIKAHAAFMLSRMARQVCEQQGIEVADIDWFVPHQANRRIIDASAEKLGIAPEKVVTTVERHGNTSAASIPLALDVAVRDGRIKRGDVVMIEAVGGGFTWGAAIIRW